MALPMGFILRVLRKTAASRVHSALVKRPRPAHILFCNVDHFEPGFGHVTTAVERQRMDDLLEKYPLLADRHRDAFGNRPGRTWFFPPHYHVNGSLRALTSLCQRGYGEIELHLHHGKTQPDTAENLAHTIELCLRDYGRFGLFGRENGATRYGFVHGDWALNNSARGGRYCGVNNELAVLKQSGCYADFTFPSCCECNPTQINSIYYADIHRHVPKAGGSGVPVRVGAAAGDGLMVIQGPARPAWFRGRPSFGDGIHDLRHPTAAIIDGWVAAWVHVAGREDWVVVKTHTHGAPNGASMNGQPMHEGFEHLEARYNDGKHFILHYVTARELYNIVKAAEAGEAGNPEEYRDYLVKPPTYDSSPEISEASPELKDAIARTYRG